MESSSVHMEKVVMNLVSNAAEAINNRINRLTWRPHFHREEGSLCFYYMPILFFVIFACPVECLPREMRRLFNCGGPIPLGRLFVYPVKSAFAFI